MRRFPVDDLRRQFPALHHNEIVLFDNAAGAQVPACVLEAVTDHLVARNVQRGGPYRQSREVDAMIDRARASVGDFVNARDPGEIAFGLNATSFMRAISIAVGQTLGARPDIVVTDLDHESNVATWLALERMGASIVWWRVRDDGRLHTADLDGLLTDRTRLVACTAAANATGPIVVRAWDCDYLVCSGYKIFAPHMGFAWCRREAIDRLPTFREDFIPDAMPYKLEAGTFVYENVAGMEAAVGYLEALGRRLAAPGPPSSRRAAIVSAMAAIADYERDLSAAMLDAIGRVPGATVYGVTARERLAERVPTFCFTVAGADPAALAAALAERGIAVRSGHMYSPRVMTRLGLMPSGALRASLVHYNTLDEIGAFAEQLTRACGN